MATQTATLHVAKEIALTTALTELVFGPGVNVIWVSAGSALYVSIDGTKADGDAISSTARFQVPGNTAFPIRRSGQKTFVAAVQGTPTAWLLGSDA